MAKSTIGRGQFRGKLGGDVFFVSNGEQIVRAYQPIVANPKSVGQNLQRAKGNLAGRMSSFVPRTALFGMGRNARIRRSEFLRNILKSASAVQVGNDFTAKINPADVLFSKGTEILAVTLAGITASSHNVAVVLVGASTTTIDPAMYASRLVRIVVMVYEQNSNNLVEVSTKLANMPNQGETATTYLQVGYPNDYDVFVYAIPMSTEDGSAASVNTSVVSLDDDVIAASLSVNGNAVVFKYGNSIYLGEANYNRE